MNPTLTSQEKKVLGFLILMVGLGLVMLAVQKQSGSASQAASVVATQTP